MYLGKVNRVFSDQINIFGGNTGGGGGFPTMIGLMKYLLVKLNIFLSGLISED